MRARTTALAAFLALAAGRAGARTEAPAVVAIDAGGLTDLAVGESVRLGIRDLRTGSASDAKATFSVSPAALATVDAEGTLRALAPGHVVVTAAVEGRSPGPTPLRVRVREDLPVPRLPWVSSPRPPDELDVDALLDGTSLTLRATWRADGTALFVRTRAIPTSGLPARVGIESATIGPLDGRTPAALLTGGVELRSFRAGVLRASVDARRTDQSPVRLDFLAALEPVRPLALAAVDEAPVDQPAAAGRLRGLRLAPRGDPPSGGLVVLPESFGLNRHVRGAAAEWASEGYEVLALDLYDGETAREDPRRAEALASALDDRAVEAAIDAAVESLARPSAGGAPRPVGVLGWGLGGRWAVRTARRRSDLAACVTFYGARAADVATPWPDSPRLFAAFGLGDDSPGAPAARALREAVSASPAHEVHVLEGRAHVLVSPYWSFGTGYDPGRAIQARVRDFVRRALAR